MARIRADIVPENVDGPSLVAAASGLMLLPENASRQIRLHRLAALGMSLDDRGASPLSSSAVRSILKKDDIGGAHILMQEDSYSEVLIQSISFIGGPYLVSPGSGEHTVADVENLIDAAFRDEWIPADLRGPARQLIQGLLTVSDMVLKRAGLARGTLPRGSARTAMEVPGAAGLRHIAEATLLSNDDLDAHSSWLRMVVDTFALDPGALLDPCASDVTDDRLYITPFLRLADGYRVVLPLDLLVTIRFHLLRFALQAGQLEELGKRWREAAFRRLGQLLPYGSSPVLLEESSLMSRYLLRIDSKRDVHVILATDPLVDWQLEVWGSYDSSAAMGRLSNLMSPRVRRTYSTAEELFHLVLVDSPGRAAFWGVPNIDGIDPVLIARADDLEVMLHHEPDGLHGLLLFAQAIERRPGESMSTDILDEFCSYLDHEKSFYLSDFAAPTFTVFQPGDGLYPRQRYYAETDRHGVIPPLSNPLILQAQRLYPQDAPEIFLIEPTSSYIGYVVELGDQSVFVTLDRKQTEFAGIEPDLMECVAYWVRECANRIGARTVTATEIVLKLSAPESWKRARERSKTDTAVRVTPAGSRYTFEFTETFEALLQDDLNTAERELVTVLLVSIFGAESSTLASTIDSLAPLGMKRMLHAFDQHGSPDMLAERLPRPLIGHDQISAQLLDELGEWLRSPNGGNFSAGKLEGEGRVRVLNAAVTYLFERLEREVAQYDQRNLLDFLVAQNETLLHDAKFNAIMLKSRLACFGQQSYTVTELVNDRKNSATSQRANRFLIEYVAAQPPTGTRIVEPLDYYRLLGLATEIIQRATTSDFLLYDLADFDVSILGSGRLGVSREEPVTQAMETYATNSGMRSVQAATSVDESHVEDDVDVAAVIAGSEYAMRAEFGFTLNELREVCGGLLDLATADQVSRIDRSLALSKVAEERGMPEGIISTVLDAITISERSSFLEIGPDAYPWRFNRDISYTRRPVVLQGSDLVFGFRSIHMLGPFWVENILSGRLQGRAKTIEMQQYISDARGEINDAFARSVAARLKGIGMSTKVSVKKIGGLHMLDDDRKDIGDIDVLAIHTETRSIIAIEAKDFELARTPAEMARELEKLFTGKKGKKSTIQLHTRRINWLRDHLHQVVSEMDIRADDDTAPWHVIGAVVTSEPLVTPHVSTSTLPVIPLDDLGLNTLHLTPHHGRPPSTRKAHKKHPRR